jgi:antitoxin ParD1/3/4
MNISLTPMLENFVQNKIAEGLYTSASEVIREALRLLITQEMSANGRIEMLNKEIDKGLEDFKNGNFRDGNEVMEELIKKYG